MIFVHKYKKYEYAMLEKCIIDLFVHCTNLILSCWKFASIALSLLLITSATDAADFKWFSENCPKEYEYLLVENGKCVCLVRESDGLHVKWISFVCWLDLYYLSSIE